MSCSENLSYNKELEAHNNTITERVKKNLTKVYTINTVGISLEAKTYGHLRNNTSITILGIPYKIEIRVGSRGMLRRNMNVNHALINGSMELIRKIEFPALRRDQLEIGELPQAPWVTWYQQIHNQPRIGVLIEPSSKELDSFQGQGKIERRILPTILCWSVAVYKLQGTILDRSVVDLSSHLFTKGLAYIALSRLRSLPCLAVSSVDPKRLLNLPLYQNSLKELECLQNL